MNLELSEHSVEQLDRYRKARRAWVALGRESERSVADEVNAEYRIAIEGLAYALLVDEDRQLAAKGRMAASENGISSSVALVEALDSELDALRRDAERYRVLREHWVRIEDGTTVHRADGLDLWCDKYGSSSEKERHEQL